jgi:hypothetical protein
MKIGWQVLRFDDRLILMMMMMMMREARRADDETLLIPIMNKNAADMLHNRSWK